MSRFFAGSDSESESSSSEEEQFTRLAAPKTAFTFSEDEEESGKRVVRSAKDKRFDEMNIIIKRMKNHKKIKDMSNVLSDFESLCKAFDKAKKVVDKEGIPRFYIRCLVDLEDFINECWEDREGRKAMSKNNARGLTTLRQKLRKYNRDFEKDIETYRENPDQAEQEEEEPEEGSEDEDSIDAPIPAATAFLKKDAPEETAPDPSRFLKGGDSGEDDSDSDYWRDSEESDESSSEEEYGDLRLKFLKKTPAAGGGEDKRKKEEKKKKEPTRRPRERIEEEEQNEEGWEKVPGGPGAKRQRLFPKDAEITHELVVKKLNELVSARGKKGTDRNEMIELLTELRNIAKTNDLGPALDTKILLSIIAAVYDYNPNIATCMKAEIWEKCLNFLDELLEHLIANPDIIVGPNVTDDSESFVAPGPYRVHGSVLSQIERMDEEFTKMLQACDAHSTEYVERLKDEGRVYKLILKLEGYLENRGTTEEICRVYIKRIDHIYYKFDTATAKYASPEDPNRENPREVMTKMCQYIYAKDDTDRLRTRAILCHIYHNALHDRWFEARDLMLMSHLQDTIQHSDISTQILYNRAMVQLGLCAFRAGMIKDAHNCLVDIQSTGRAKELLAQGLLLQRQHERTAEQEKIEKRRQMPYHKHINLELLECVYLVSAMLMEIPYMAAHEFDARRRLISKNFHHVMRVSERQNLVGPPESMREHVVAASKAMKSGNWRQCRDFVINEKMNAKVWDLFNEVDIVRNMLVQKIQEESLRTYLFTYSQVYDSLSLETMAEMFELDKSVVHSIISKMIINEELMASMDEPSQAVVMHRTEPSRLQSLALQLSEKVANLSENNEKIMEMKQGGGFFPYQKQGQGFQQGDQNRDSRDRKFGQRDGGYQQRGGYQSRGQGYGQKDGGYQQRGGYQSRGQGYGQKDGGYQQRGGYQSRGQGYGSGGGYRNKDQGDYGYVRPARY